MFLIQHLVYHFICVDALVVLLCLSIYEFYPTGFASTFLLESERVSMAGNYKPSFAQKVRGNTAVNLARPTCLNFKTKTNLRRVEDLQMLSEIGFKTENIIGVAEIRNRSIDITCKTREKVLEL